MPVDSEGREPGERGYDRADAEVRELEHGKDKKPAAGDAGKPFLKAHRDQILIVLTLAGVMIAWLTFRKPKSTDPTSASYDPTAAAGTPSTAGPDPSGGAMDGFAAYLSHQSDLLDQLNTTIGSLASGTGGASTSTPSPFDYSSMNHSWAAEPTSAPARFLYGPAARGLRYIRNAANGAIYQINPNGKAFHLTAQQYAELGRPAAVNYGHPPARPPKPPKRHRPPTKKG